MTDAALFTIVLLALACVSGWFLFWLAARKAGRALDGKDIEIKNLKDEKDNKINQLEEEIRKYIKEKEDACKEAALIQGRFEGLKNLQGELRAQMKNEFSVVAQELLHKNTRHFSETSQERVQNLLKPLAQQIEGFQKRVNEVHDSSVRNFGSMEKSVELVRQTGRAMSEEAGQLTQALRGNKQLLGAWGEMQLETTLQAAGMIEGTHYRRQESYRDAQNQSRRLDFVVNLPKNKHIVIDAKTTLNSYVDMNAAESDEERGVAEKAFFQAIQQHVEGLSRKDYHAIEELDSPMYVLMYIPLESAYLQLLRSNMKIFDEAYRKNIVLVSHTTLLPVLRTVSNLWMMEESSSNARSILDQAGGLYRQLLIISKRMSTLGSRLNSAADMYNDLITSFSGRQGLVNKISKFRELSDKSGEDPQTPRPVSVQCLPPGTGEDRDAPDTSASEPDETANSGSDIASSPPAH